MKYIGEFKKATQAIGSMIPNITPKVTEYIQAIIDYIDNLVKIHLVTNMYAWLCVFLFCHMLSYTLQEGIPCLLVAM